MAQALRIAARPFGATDPLGVAIGMTAKDIEAFVLVFGAKAVAEGLTVIARERSGALVGAMFSDDYRRTRSIVEGSHVHFNMLAVVPTLSGRGIAQKLVELGMENAARRGYRFALTEANGPVSQHIFRWRSTSMSAERSSVP